MNQSEKLQQYAAKKQQAREHAQYLRQQRAANQNKGGGDNSYASRGNSFNQNNRIVGDPFRSSSSMQGTGNNTREKNMIAPWNNGGPQNFDSISTQNNKNNQNQHRAQFGNHNYDNRSRFGGNNNRAGYGNDTPFGKQRHNNANTGFDDNATPDFPYNNGNDGYRGGFNNHNVGNNRSVNDWENTQLPKYRNNRSNQFTNTNFDTRSQAHRGDGGNVNNFGAKNGRATNRTNHNVNSMQHTLGADNNDVMVTKTREDGRGGSNAVSSFKSSDHVAGCIQKNNIQYATADDVKKVLAMVDQLRGQMHALQFQINDVKEQNVLLKQRVNELEEQLRQQHQKIKKQTKNNMDNSFQAQEPAVMSRNANSHQINDNRSNTNQFGGSSMHNNRNQCFNGNSLNSLHQQNNGNFAMDIGRPTASGPSMRTKEKQQTQSQSDRIGNNSNQFNQSDNNDGFDPNTNRNSNKYTNFHNDAFASSSRNMDHMNSNNQPFSGDDEEQAKAPPPSSAADLIAKLEQEQDAFIDSEQLQRIECHQCGRKFTEKALQRHLKICKKVFGQKRKQFNMAQQRADEEALKAAANTNRRQIEAALARKREKQTKKWKAQSSMLRQAVRQSKAIDQAIKEGKPLAELPSIPAMPAILDDRVLCPHCGRKFAEETAKRHIPKCQNIKSRPKALKRRKLNM